MTLTPDLELLRQEWLADPSGELRRSPRRRLSPPQPVTVLAETLGLEPLPADLVDTSAGGVCLALSSPCPLQVGDALRIVFEASPPRRGRVCWREDAGVIAALGVAYADS